MSKRPTRGREPTIEVVRRDAPGAPPSQRPPGPRAARPAAPAPSRPRAPHRAPPEPERVAAFARQEHVPMPVARRILGGYTTLEVWRREHARESAWWAQAYAYVEQNPGGLPLDQALDAIARGETPEARLARTRTVKAKAEEARAAVPNAPVEAYLGRLVAGQVPVAVRFARGGFTDVLAEDLGTKFRFAEHGAVKKLKIVTVAAAAASHRAERVDEALAAEPAPVPGPLATRVVVDPRLFASLVGRSVRVALRDGRVYALPLVAAGRFDLLLGETGGELLVPLHAIVEWEAVAASPPAPA